MFDGILFDLDGTLWDATPEITFCWNQALVQNHVSRPPLTIEEIRSCMGMLLDDIAATRLPNESKERRSKVIQDCLTIEMDYLSKHGGALFPGEEETLALLMEQCPLFVVSNCQDGYIQAFYEGTGLGKYFADFESAGRTGKPKSENIALMVERHGLKRPVYVGDTELDFTSARDAGVPFVHAAYGFGKVDGVPAVHAFRELPETLEKLSR